MIKNWYHQTDILRICLSTNLTDDNTQEQIHYNQESPSVRKRDDGMIMHHNTYYLYDNETHVMALKPADWVTGDVNWLTFCHRSRCVENSIWKRLWTCRKTDYVRNEWIWCIESPSSAPRPSSAKVLHTTHASKATEVKPHGWCRWWHLKLLISAYRLLRHVHSCEKCLLALSRLSICTSVHTYQ
jgi:hypothetical protein